MFHIQRIESFDVPGLEPYLTLRRQEEHRQQRIFVAEGEKVVRRLLTSSLPVTSVMLPDKWLASFEPLLAARPEDIQVFVGEKELLEKLTGFTMYQGVLAVASMPPDVDVETVLATNPRPYLLAALEEVSNAQNIGVVVRNCAAFGVQALLMGDTCNSPYLRRAVRSSMGTIFKLPVIEGVHLATVLGDLRGRGIHNIAAHPHTDRRRVLSQANFRQDCCIVFGSEGNGLSPEVLRACDDAVVIPMHGGVDSLNVGSAAAAFLYEAARQRGQA
jgi:tRNA G18 (ribose-2'-O)-methylase SpoU